MGIPLCVIYCFSLVVFSIFSLYLILLVSLICVSAWSSWVYPVWDSALSGLRWLFPFPCYRSFPLWSLQIFSDSLSFSPTPIIWKLALSWRLLGLSSFYFILFFFFVNSAPWQRFPPFCLPCHLSVLPLLFCYQLLLKFSFQLLSCSSLFVCSLVLLDLC